MTNPNLPDPVYDAAYYDGVVPKRAFAWLIDAGLVLVAMVILSVTSAGIFFVLWVPVHLAVAFLYRWLTISARSATFGMRVMNIELCSNRGTPLTRAEAAVHTASFLLCVSFFLPQLLSIAMMLGRPLNRGIPDELVRTVMINRST